MRITSDQWLLLSPYLDEALGRNNEELASWLSSLRRENPAIANLLESLLRDHHKISAEGFLEEGPVGFTRQAGLAGQVVGAYKLVSQIGLGGMGSVWLAERVDGRF